MYYIVNTRNASAGPEEQPRTWHHYFKPTHPAEINTLRASSMQLAAKMSVSQSLVAHLNNAMKSAVERADDGDAAMGEVVRQLEEARRQLQAMHNEQVGAACGGGGGGGVGGARNACARALSLSLSLSLSYTHTHHTHTHTHTYSNAHADSNFEHRRS